MAPFYSFCLLYVLFYRKNINARIQELIDIAQTKYTSDSKNFCLAHKFLQNIQIYKKGKQTKKGASFAYETQCTVHRRFIRFILFHVLTRIIMIVFERRRMAVRVY